MFREFIDTHLENEGNTIILYSTSEPGAPNPALIHSESNTNNWLPLAGSLA